MRLVSNSILVEGDLELLTLCLLLPKHEITIGLLVWIMCYGDQTQLLLFARQEKLSPTAEKQNLVRKERRWTVVHTCNPSFGHLREEDRETLSKLKSKERHSDGFGLPWQ